MAIIYILKVIVHSYDIQYAIDVPMFETPLTSTETPLYYSWLYGVASISRLLKMIGLFYKRALWKRLYFAKETYNFKEPTNRSHPIVMSIVYSDGYYIYSRCTICNRCTCTIIYIVCGICGTLVYLYTYTYTHDIQYAIGVKSYTLYVEYVVHSYTYIYTHILTTFNMQ